ncbi:MAG: hypothetical protein R3D59_11665 [Paracoccaceae bacterium]
MIFQAPILALAAVVSGSGGPGVALGRRVQGAGAPALGRSEQRPHPDPTHRTGFDPVRCRPPSPRSRRFCLFVYNASRMAEASSSAHVLRCRHAQRQPLGLSGAHLEVAVFFAAALASSPQAGPTGWGRLPLTRVKYAALLPIAALLVLAAGMVGLFP